MKITLGGGPLLERPLHLFGKKGWLALGLAVTFGLMPFLLADWDNPPQWLLFLGSFHPAFIHFPIGILLLVGLLEVLARLLPDLKELKSLTAFILLLGAASAVVASVLGLLFSVQGGHSGTLIFWHKWLGFAVAGGSVAAVVLRHLSAAGGRRSAFLQKAYILGLAVTMLAIIATGHLGASMAHGTGYFTRYMPPSLKALIGVSFDGRNAGQIDIDSAAIFDDLVEPIFEERCIKCHSEEKHEGGLRLDRLEHILAGGESGKILVPGKPDESEIVRRITLPLYDKERMPPDGEDPLTVGDTELIRWWIREGASANQKVLEARQMPSSVQTVLNRLSAPREAKKTGIDALQIPAPDPKLIAKVRAEGIKVQLVSEGAPYVAVDLSNREETITLREIGALRPLFAQIIWLDLSHSRLSKEALGALKEMKHLTRLYLQHSDASDSTLVHLKHLQHLEYLNLYGTEISDAGLNHLGRLSSLKTLYLWQTNVTQAGVSNLEKELPGLDVNIGVTEL